MPGKPALKAMPTPVTYLYDGSFDGFLCCVRESVYERELPQDILPENDAPPSFDETKFIATDKETAEKVLSSIPEKISAEVLTLVRTVFLSCLPQKELKTLRFLLRAYKTGGKIMEMHGDEDVEPLLKAARHVGCEAQLLKGFVRFTDHGSALTSVISPKNYILPFIADHFTARFAGETFMIFDKTHKAALIWQNGEAAITEIDSVEFPPATPQEERYRALWKHFYNTIAITARTNPRCRMTLMPKRYWENMLEVSDLLNPPQPQTLKAKTGL